MFHIRWPCMFLIYTPVCKFAQNFDAMLIYDLFSILLIIYGDHACISSIHQPVSLLKTLMQCWFMTCFLSFCFIYGDHACISSILQPVSLLKTLMQCWFMNPAFHIRWPCMHLIYTPGCKCAQNFDAMLIYDLFTILLFHIRWPCMHLNYTPACKFAKNLMQCWFMTCFLSFCFTYGDHACISSLLQFVSLLKILM